MRTVDSKQIYTDYYYYYTREVIGADYCFGKLHPTEVIM